ncbi:MAG: beta-galactosidase [Actinomycetota bacterium]|nr:beta-galactosidase [Actinomycetota bacterium]
MTTAGFGPRGLEIDGQAVPIAGGEFHYWRHNHLYWEPTLDLMRDAGVELVSTFVCWDFHEIERGRYDFVGETNGSRNLLGFLDACADRSLRVIARPGPYIDAEWITRGPAPDVATLERLDPQYLERAGEWIDAVGDALAPYQVTRGGPIALLAIDNEVYFPYTSDPEVFDVDGDILVPYNEKIVLAQFSEWLSKRYENPEAMDESWGTSHGTFAVPTPRFGKHMSKREALDCFDFINDRCRTFIDWAIDRYRSAGFDIPAYTNQKQMLTYLDWPDIGASLESSGLNLCMPNLLPRQQLAAMSWFCRIQRSRQPFTWSPEYQGGWIGFDEYFGVITPEHCEYMPLLGMAYGIRGMSFFMFVERDDWNWSPINSHAKPRRDRLRAFEGALAVLKQLDLDDEQLGDIGLIWSLRQQQLFLADQDGDWTDLFKGWLRLDDPKEVQPWWQCFSRLESEDWDFRIYDPAAGKPAPAVMIWCGTEGVERTEVGVMVDAIKVGSVLLAVTPLPTTDPAGEKDQRIADLWGQARETGRVHQVSLSQLAPSLAQTKAKRYVTTSGGNVRSMAYKGDSGTTVFVINNDVFEQATTLALHGELVEDLGTVRDLWDGSLVEKDLQAPELPLTLKPKSVRVLRFENS